MAWYENPDEVWTFALILDAADHWSEPIEVIRYFEKPWHFDPEHVLWEQLDRPDEDDPDRWERWWMALLDLQAANRPQLRVV